MTIATITETAAERDRLREINAGMLAALRACYSELDCLRARYEREHPAGQAEPWSALRMARTAIARAEGR